MIGKERRDFTAPRCLNDGSNTALRHSDGLYTAVRWLQDISCILEIYVCAVHCTPRDENMDIAGLKAVGDHNRPDLVELPRHRGRSKSGPAISTNARVALSIPAIVGQTLLRIATRANATTTHKTSPTRPWAMHIASFAFWPSRHDSEAA